jgi:hypothetical protein
MRYSQGYDEWATQAEERRATSDRERAQLTASKIRDNHSGSAQDRRELARMEHIAAGGVSDDAWSYGTRTAATDTAVVVASHRTNVEPSHCSILSFFVEGVRLEISVHDLELNISRIEQLISFEIGCRNDLDLTINGFQGVSKLTKLKFKGKIKVADYDTEEEEDCNERVILIDAAIIRES